MFQKFQNRFCSPSRAGLHRGGTALRNGLTLLELLIAISIMVIIVGTLSGLAKAVQLSSEYSEGHGSATQHARVAMERITRMVSEATANKNFPGFIVIDEEVAGWRFPDTLVVWHPQRTDENPQGLPADPGSLPPFGELVIYCPYPTDPKDPENPKGLVEITFPGDSEIAPGAEDEDKDTWRLKIAAIKKLVAEKSVDCRVVTLTELLRTCPVPESANSLRGAVRFESKRSLVDGVCSYQTDLWQAWLRMELQLMPGEAAASNDPGGQQAIPFLGSAALYYLEERE